MVKLIPRSDRMMPSRPSGGMDRIYPDSYRDTEIFKYKVGKRIYSRAVAKAKCAFESHRGNKKSFKNNFYCAKRLHANKRGLYHQTKNKGGLK